MDFSENEDLKAVRELAREILEAQLPTERIRDIGASSDGLDRDCWAALARANLLGAALPEAVGGSGLGLPALAVLLEEVGRTVAPVPALATLALGAAAIDAFGSDAQVQQWLPGVVDGSVLLSATTAAGTEVRAERNGTAWRLMGQAPLVPAARHSGALVTPAMVEGDGLRLFLVNVDTAGVTCEPVIAMDGQPRDHVTFTGVAAEPLGSVDSPDAAIAPDWLDRRATLASCALQLGVCARALEITAGYVREREQFGRPVGSFQAVHTRAADAYIDLQSVRLTYWRALHVEAHGGGDAQELIGLAKYWASEAGTRITASAQHLHGGIGVDVEYPIHRYTLWSRQLAMQMGSAPEQLARLRL